ncbi:MAG: hypothetical protein DRJ69_04420 [Thermoprotei archaeon]|nr:MAG: hypothetical protein DRJ69_04420 [Thermoprotei archaeon]
MSWLRRLLERAKLPKQLLSIVVVAMCAVIFGGALFCILNWETVSRVSAQAAAMGKSFAFEIGLSPLSMQTYSEAFFVSLMLLMITGGLVLIHDGASKPREPRDALIVTLMGLTLLIMGLAGWWWLALRILT